MTDVEYSLSDVGISKASNGRADDESVEGYSDENLNDDKVTSMGMDKMEMENEDGGGEVGGEEEDNLSSPWRSLYHLFYNHRGIFLASFSTFLFAFQTVLLRYVEDDLHVMEVSFSRYVFQAIIVTPAMLHSNVSFRPESRKVLLLHLMRGLFGMLAYNAFFYSIIFTRIGDAAAIVMSQLVFVGIFARIFMKEPCGVYDGFLVLMSLAGIVLIAQPPFLFRGSNTDGNGSDNSQFVGAFIAFFASVSFAAGNVVTSYLGKMNVNPAAIVWYYAVLGSVGTGLFTTIIGAWSMPPCGNARLTLISMGIIHCLAQYFLTYSYSIENTVLVSIMLTNESIYSYLLEFALFGVRPDMVALIGGGVLLISSILASLKKVWLARREKVKRRTLHGSHGHLPESPENERKMI